MDSVMEKIPYLLNWYIPDGDKYLIYAYKELMRWGGENGWTILVVSNILAYLKILAMKTKNVVDDKIVSLLIYVLSGKWISALKEPVLGTKNNPIPLTEVVEDQTEKREKNSAEVRP
jgi:hypothetical protein